MCDRYMCNTHILHTCSTCLEYAPVLHMYFYTCNTGTGYTLVSHDCVKQGYYQCSSHVSHVYEIHM